MREYSSVVKSLASMCRPWIQSSVSVLPKIQKEGQGGRDGEGEKEREKARERRRESF